MCQLDPNVFFYIVVPKTVPGLEVKPPSVQGREGQSLPVLQEQLFHWEYCFYFPVFQKELSTQNFPLPS